MSTEKLTEESKEDIIIAKNTEFWHTVDELTPPIGRNVWVTTKPYCNTPTVRLDSWNGGTWKHHRYRNCYWAYPISRKR